MYDKVRYSKQPEDQEAFLRMYRAIADDPQLLQQLQPKDFMVALNSTRDLLHVIPRMQRIIQDVERTKHRSVPEIYHILLKHYTKLSDFKHCRDLLKRMTQAGIDFNLHTYHIMLSICKHERQLRRATFILEEIRAKKIEITESTYLMMMSVCVACKNPRKAREYFEEMPLIGLEQQLSHYNTLLNAYVHAKDLEGARNVFSEMEENDEITPDSYSYAAMIKILKSPKYHRPTEAEELVKTMERRGLKPNARVLMALQVNPLKVQQTCEATGVELTVQDYNLLIGTSIRQNQFQDIPALFTAMSNQGLRPDMVTFTMMVDANLKMNKYPEAKEIFWAMQQANIQPDVVAYSALMTGALLQSKVLESLEILKRMLNDGMLPNLLTFNSLLSASVGEIDVKGFKMIRETMDALKIRPDNRSFNALLSAYALKGDIQEMMCTLDDMRRSNVFPDALTYSVLISGFLRNGDLRFAVDWYFKMQESGMKPATTVVNNLMAALHGSSEGQKVLMLFHDMGDRMIRKDERTYEIVLDTCTKFNLHSSRHAIEEEFKEYLANQSLKEDMIKRKNIKN
ncbi:hypothetical protein BG004_004211 [Podila humilis]|nr:hypothetical protein BG004_004211 [Podila humilis]